MKAFYEKYEFGIQIASVMIIAIIMILILPDINFPEGSLFNNPCIYCP
jgi:hypothetical protein